MQSRLLGLDVFRGLTIVLMILVNSLDHKVRLLYLQHAKWHGATLADMVFPFFLIMVGIAIVLKYANPKPHALSEIFRRSLWLFTLGLFLNAFPHILNVSHLRVMGVLQRIAICYGIAALLCLHTSVKQQLSIIIFILLSYWMLSIYSPTTYLGHFSPDCRDNILGCIDRWFFSSQHLHRPYFDPEGLLSTYPALASCLIGNLIGYAFLAKRGQSQLRWGLFIVGLSLCLLGYYWGEVYPINKLLWSSSYVLWTSGWAMLVLLICLFVAESTCLNALVRFLSLFGRHSLLIYMLHVMGLKLQYLQCFGANMSCYQGIHQALQQVFSAPVAAIIYSLLYIGLCYLILSRTALKKNSPNRG